MGKVVVHQKDLHRYLIPIDKRINNFNIQAFEVLHQLFQQPVSDTSRLIFWIYTKNLNPTDLPQTGLPAPDMP